MEDWFCVYCGDDLPEEFARWEIDCCEFCAGIIEEMHDGNV